MNFFKRILMLFRRKREEPESNIQEPKVPVVPVPPPPVPVPDPTVTPPQSYVEPPKPTTTPVEPPKTVEDGGPSFGPPKVRNWTLDLGQRPLDFTATVESRFMQLCDYEKFAVIQKMPDRYNNTSFAVFSASFGPPAWEGAGESQGFKEWLTKVSYSGGVNAMYNPDTGMFTSRGLPLVERFIGKFW